MHTRSCGMAWRAGTEQLQHARSHCGVRVGLNSMRRACHLRTRHAL
jgi:hypothetical protein